ncbi:nucleotide-binding protein [Duganella vulcania]|uniref:AAA family ATPase n=1 Tax=Duganella vulcania TaxID=2692166 RepID=A0A845GJC5_9BURK|nr:AAA family ATPase [Duganella vulcania]MYM92759.1 AAA family ATPase [Duganella vulcania]
MVITIGAEKGGVAKTRLATHIAALGASQGVDVVLLDTDKQGSAMSWGSIRNEEGVQPSIPVLSLPAKPAAEIANLAGKYSLVVVDIGAQNYRTMLECAQLSDLVLVPCGPDQQEIESTLNVFEALRALDPRHEKGRIPAHVVLTRVSTKENAKATLDLRAMFAEEGVPVCKSHIAQREAWRATGKTGRALHELKGSDRSLKAIDEMQALYDEVVSLANQE